MISEQKMLKEFRCQSRIHRALKFVLSQEVVLIENDIKGRVVGHGMNHKWNWISFEGEVKGDIWASISSVGGDPHTCITIFVRGYISSITATFINYLESHIPPSSLWPTPTQTDRQGREVKEKCKSENFCSKSAYKEEKLRIREGKKKRQRWRKRKRDKQLKPILSTQKLLNSLRRWRKQGGSLSRQGIHKSKVVVNAGRRQRSLFWIFY